MIAPLPDLESLRCFHAVARRLSFRGAADEVHLTPAALSKRVAQLERQLGQALFQRTTRRVALTEAGLRLVPRAAALLEAAADCVRDARGGPPPPLELTLGTRQELGLSWLLPALDDLERARPGLRLHLYFGSGADLELRVRSSEVDLAVTSRATTDPALDALRLHEEAYVLVGAPALLRRVPLRRPDDAARHVLVDAHRSLPLWSYWRAAAPPGVEPRWGDVRVLGTVAAVRWLVLRGRGVAVLPRYLVAPDLARRRLRVLLPSVTPRSDHFRLLFRRDDPRRGVFDALATALRALPLR